MFPFFSSFAFIRFTTFILFFIVSVFPVPLIANSRNIHTEQHDVHLSKRILAHVCQDPITKFPVPFLNGDQLISSLNVDTLSLDFSTETIQSIGAGTASSQNILVKMAPLSGPLSGVDMAFKEIKQTLGIIPENEKRPVANMQIPWTSCEGTFKTDMTLDIPTVRLNVLHQNPFAEFIRQVTFHEGPLNVTMQGNAELKARSEREFQIGPWRPQMGVDLCMTDLKFTKPIVLEGMQGLKDGQVLDVPQVVEGDEEKGISLEIPFSLRNPSNVALKVDHVNANLYYQQEKIGSVLIENLNLKPREENEMVVKSIIKPLTEEAINKSNTLFSEFAQGKSSMVQIFGHENSTQVDFLIPALSSWSIETEIPGIESGLVEFAHFTMPNLSTMSCSAKIKAKNPFKLPVTIKKIKGSMKRFHQPNVQIGLLDQHFDSFVLKPEQSLESPVMQLKANINFGMIWELLSHGKVLVNLETEIDMLVGSFPIKIKYIQYGVPSYFRLWI